MYNIKALKEEFYDVLMHNFVNFWETHSPDKEYGGFLCGFDREGNLGMATRPQSVDVCETVQ